MAAVSGQRPRPIPPKKLARIHTPREIPNDRFPYFRLSTARRSKRSSTFSVEREARCLRRCARPEYIPGATHCHTHSPEEIYADQNTTEKSRCREPEWSAEAATPIAGAR